MLKVYEFMIEADGCRVFLYQLHVKTPTRKLLLMPKRLPGAMFEGTWAQILHNMRSLGIFDPQGVG